jgi:hypothetical protein
MNMLDQTIEMLPKRERRKARPIEAPTSSPLLSIVGGTPGAHHLRFWDSFSKTSHAKPFGAAFLQVLVMVGHKADSPVQEFRDCFLVTKCPFTFDFRHIDDGRTATYQGRWVSRRGEAGPWGPPVSMTIAA